MSEGKRTMLVATAVGVVVCGAMLIGGYEALSIVLVGALVAVLYAAIFILGRLMERAGQPVMSSNDISPRMEPATQQRQRAIGGPVERIAVTCAASLVLWGVVGLVRGEALSFYAATSGTVVAFSVAVYGLQRSLGLESDGGPRPPSRDATPPASPALRRFGAWLMPTFAVLFLALPVAAFVGGEAAWSLLWISAVAIQVGWTGALWSLLVREAPDRTKMTRETR
jgi:hypothetical protein